MIFAMANAEPHKTATEVGSQLREEALELLLAVHNDSGPETIRRVESWRARSPAHEAAFIDLQADWGLLEGISDDPLSRRERLLLALEGRIASTRDHPRRLLAPAAALCVCLIAVMLFPSWLNRDDPQLAVPLASSSDAMEASYRTRRGESSSQSLDDGSQLWLDWDTRVRVSYSASQRLIDLDRGRARFKVMPDTQRPFVVRIDGVDVQAVGTEFVVNRLRRKEVEVAVVEGLVGVHGGERSRETRLTAAQALLVSDGVAGEVTSRPLAEIGSWRDGVLVFENRPLVEALAELQPYTRYRLDTAGVAEPERPVSGTFVVDKADKALSALMQAFELEVERQDRKLIVLRSARPRRPR
ncbi:MAG: FecR domain-containing protein [Pseudomonadota bacterium]